MLLQTKRLHENAILPSYASDGDAGLDLYSTHRAEVNPGKITTISTGIAVAIPHGYVGLVHPRSGLAAKHGISVVNTPGTIDSGYRGEVKVLLTSHLDGMESFKVEAGDRIAQLVIQKVERALIVETDELPDSQRGTGGFGSTGR